MPTSRPDPTKLQALWHGSPLSPLHRAALKSFVDRGHAIDLYTYDPIDVPAGVTRRDAAEILPLESVFFFKNPQTLTPDLGPFSDLFRFKLLRDHGGWYVDVDTFCTTDGIPPWKQAWSRDRRGSTSVGTGQIAIPAGSELASALYEDCLEASKTYGVREALGPHVITRKIRELGLPLDVNGAPETFYPIEWIETFKLWLPEFADEMTERTRDAVFLPYYQSLARYMGFLEAGPPAGSLMAALLERHADTDLPPSEDPQVVRQKARDWFERNAPWAAQEYLDTTGNPIAADLEGGARIAWTAPRPETGIASTDAIGSIDEAIAAMLDTRSAIAGRSAVPDAFVHVFAVDTRGPPEPGGRITADLSVDWEGPAPDFRIRQIPAGGTPLAVPGRAFLVSLVFASTTEAPFVQLVLTHPRLKDGGRLTAIVHGRSSRPIHITASHAVGDVHGHIGDIHLRDVPRLRCIQADLPPSPDADPRIVLHVPAVEGEVQFSRLDLLVAPGEQA